MTVSALTCSAGMNLPGEPRHLQAEVFRANSGGMTMFITHSSIMQ